MQKEYKHSLYLGLPTGKNYGWGVCSDYLKKELEKKINIYYLEKLSEKKVSGKVFHALTDINFFSLFNTFGEQNYGYTFFENELNNNSLQNSKNYDIIFAGSTWCKDKLLEKDITNSQVLIQGIDTNLFHPITEEKEDDNFVIFSGGKFEFRKGQDLVLKAIKILQKKYKNIILINLWYNFWQETIFTMKYSKHIDFEYKGHTWREIIKNLCYKNGLNTEGIITYKDVPHQKLKNIFSKTDIGVFPNRCEGGTNLILMEYMACGKPVIASYTSGHKDILNSENSIMLTNFKNIDVYDENDRLISKWEEVVIDELVDKIEFAYHNRNILKNIGKKASENLKYFTWENTADHLIKTIF